MNTSEIAALYIKHADDFKTLLGVGPYGFVALFADNIRLFIPNETVTSWHTGQQPIVTTLAVAAMESAWRSKLKAEYEDYPLVGEKWAGTYSLPQRICMVVKALAAEKRAEAGMEKMGFERVEAKPADHPKSEPPPERRYSEPALRAAIRMFPGSPLGGVCIHTVAGIIDEEIAGVRKP